MRMKVVITDFVNDDLNAESAILGELAEVTALNAASEDQLAGRVEDADALMVYHELELTRRTIERLQRCRLIVRCGVGYDNVDYAFAAQRGIPVANIPDYGTEEVADSAIGMCLALTRGFSFTNVYLRDRRGPWSHEAVMPLRRLRGRAFAIVGLGRIGTATAIRARALGMDVLFYDPYKPDGYDKALGIRRVERFEELLEQAFVLSLHCPLTPETRHMINAQSLARMPERSYLINTARGAVVEPACVVAAIESGRLAGAAIDVLEREPADDTNALVAAWRDPQHPAHLRVILGPHGAFYCEEGFDDMRTKGAWACRRALCGQPIPNIINGVLPLPDGDLEHHV
jgi:C-terminal binding protein